MAQYEGFNIDQGSDVAIQLNLENLDGSVKNLTGYSAVSQLRKTVNTVDSDAVDFSVIVASPATDGVLTLSLTNTQTNALDPGRYKYDVEISHVDSASVTIVERILEGNIEVSPSITRV